MAYHGKNCRCSGRTWCEGDQDARIARQEAAQAHDDTPVAKGYQRDACGCIRVRLDAVVIACARHSAVI